MNYLDLALKYGGFTSLDKVYLQNKLAFLSDEEKLSFITPPPSVINAYFAELYQKESPQAATDYYFELSRNLHLFTDKPSFDEQKPFVRLNLSGKSYGFAYENEEEEAQVFSEKKEEITDSLLFDLAQIFPQYKIFSDNQQIKMKKMNFDEYQSETLENAAALLSDISRLQDGTIKIRSFNQEEVIELAQAYSGRGYYSYAQNQAVLYLKED
ncbi:hypothetical protein [Streptococcus mutans]|uniref:hypothetical protein n=1 Tax=Streptococcus mutans TaxID=1309 RepID=UPI0002B5CECA|nr:hypothetical protein [Streptococcus mutans]EMC45804.1 hypothetical protein SMU99_04632 [Streptococcus mutans 24]EMP62050.1 hypothetical protein D818_06454 [Streptococcus mutans KK23]MCB4994820.1 cystathionine beta-lyase [Streptococcus mutans]MCB5153687.1 cystathionine beta-lyase [Streptococcus mutans]NLQ42111.1 cystathionine beta-lyase [Streptococcus mutans]